MGEKQNSSHEFVFFLSLPFSKGALPHFPPHITSFKMLGRERGAEGMDISLSSPPFIPFPLPPALSPSLAVCRQRQILVYLGHCRAGWGEYEAPLSLLQIRQVQMGKSSQFEALLLEELEVEATAVLELPVVATDLRMCGSRKGSLAN